MMWRTSRVQFFAALFALAIFGGYLAADAIADSIHGCAAESSQNGGCDDGCVMCFSCSHGGALVGVEATIAILAAPVECDRIVAADEHAPDGPPAAIDHPPQLS